MKPIRPFIPSRPQSARGFSLVEILVGVAIGIVGMLVLFRTVAVWDTQTRSVTQGSDAQTAGSLAMFAIERDIKQAGQGFTGIGDAVPQALGCNVVGVRNFRLAPVQIVDGVPAGSPDTLQVLYGNSAFFVSEETLTASTAATKTTVRRNGFRTGDLAVAADGANCVLLEVTDDTNPDGRTLAHAVGGTYLNFYAGPPASAVPVFNDITVPALGAGWLYSLGPAPRHNTWAIDPVNPARSVLINTELFSGAVSEAGEGIVNIQAQYGLDTDNNRIVDLWNTAAPATPAAWSQVLAVRVGLLARSRQFEKSADQTNENAAATPVTTVNPAWTGGAFLMTDLDGAADTNTPDDPNNWRYYRYRVYEKTISLRNVIWGTGPGSTSITP